MFDRQALNKLYQYAISLCGQEADAYDLLQSSLEKYLKAQQSTAKSVDAPLAYMRRIMRNLYIDQYRHKQRHPSDEFDEEHHSSISDISSQSLEQITIDRNTLQHLWQQLNDKERELLYMWAVLGHTIDEIASELECPRGTLLARIHRLRKKLHSVSTSAINAGASA